MLRVELHSHTIYSKDSLLRVEGLLSTCRRKGIDRVAITDHNTTAGGAYAQRLDPGRVIVGEEIMTQAGELLAFFVSQEVPPDLPPLEAICRLRDQCAFISVSHPYDQFRNGHWEEGDLLEILPLVDAIETFNARCMRAEFNRQAGALASQRGIPGTAGSDAHAAFEIGRAAMLLPDFYDAESLRRALPQGQLDARLSSPFVHFTSRYAVWKKQLYRRQGKNLA